MPCCKLRTNGTLRSRHATHLDPFRRPGHDSGLGAADARQDSSARRGTNVSARYRIGRQQGQGSADLRSEGAARRAQCRRDPSRQFRIRGLQDVRRRDELADARSPGPGRPGLQQLPYRADLLRDARGASDRPQSAQRQHGDDLGNGHGVSGSVFGASEQRGAAREDPANERLQHRDVRQVPRIRAVGERPHGAVRSVADGARIRKVLRQHDRRIGPVLAVSARQHNTRASVQGPELLLPDRYRRSRDRLDQGTEDAQSRQAFLRLLRRAGNARSGAASRVVARQVQRQVRRGLGQIPRGNPGAPKEARHRPAQYTAHAETRRDAGLGLR